MAKRRKTGGRKAGTPNKSTEGIRVLLGRVLPDKRLEKEWEHYLKHGDPHLRFGHSSSRILISSGNLRSL